MLELIHLYTPLFKHYRTSIDYLFYRHTKEMIKKLESAGLGYHVSADDTEDKLGMMK